MLSTISSIAIILCFSYLPLLSWRSWAWLAPCRAWPPAKRRVRRAGQAKASCSGGRGRRGQRVPLNCSVSRCETCSRWLAMPACMAPKTWLAASAAAERLRGEASKRSACLDCLFLVAAASLSPSNGTPLSHFLLCSFIRNDPIPR